MKLTKSTYSNILFILLLSLIIMVFYFGYNPSVSKAIPHNNILALQIDSPEVDLPFPFKDGLGGPDNNNNGGYI